MKETPQTNHKKSNLKPHSNFDLKNIFGKDVDVIDDIIDNIDRHIRIIEIPKKDGSKRRVLAPDGSLKYVQKGIYWRLLRRYKADDSAHGFVSKRGIVTNARPHIGAVSVGKIDIKSFFDSISENHLKNCLFGNKNICRYCKNYEKMMDGRCHPSLYKNKTQNYRHKCEEIKAVFIPDYCEKMNYQSLMLRIIKLCTYKGYTAQGFPTSPILANIVLRGFDKSMKAYCKEHDITYTRYADDLAFSSKTLPKKELKRLIKTKVYRLLWAYKFEANKKKTNWKSRAGRLRICGIVVNRKTSIQKSKVKLFRAKVHHLTVKHPETATRIKLRQLKGWASYLMSADVAKGKKYMKQLCDFEKATFGKAA